MKQYLYLLVGIFSLFLLTVNSTAQNQTKIDSLKNIVKTADHDTIKINALLQWDNYIYVSDPKLDLQLNERISRLCENNINKSLTDAQKAPFKGKLATAYNNIGIIYMHQDDYSRAKDYYLRSLRIRMELADKLGVAQCYNNIGNVYHVQSNFPLALENHFMSLKIQKELGNKQGIADSYNNIGNIYDMQSDYPLALEYFFKSVKLALNDKGTLANKLSAANTYGNIGNIYHVQSKYPLALENQFKSLKLKKELGNKRGMASSYTNLGTIYISIYEQGELYAKTIGELVPKYSNILDTALYFYQQAIVLQKEVGANLGMIHSIDGIGNIHTLRQNYAEALISYQHAVQLADSIEALPEKSSSHKSLSETYEKLGELKKSLVHYRHYSTLKDSIFNKEKSKELGKLEASHEYEKQMLEQDKEHEKHQALSAAELKRQRIIGYSLSGGFGFVLILAFVIYRSYRQKKRANKLLEEKNIIIEETHKDITDSIRYAENIQSAILPEESEIKKTLPDHFVYFQPKDVVSGDFYWFTKQNGKAYIAACDCTGHGVPGAFVSMIGNDLLNQIIIERGLKDPGDILTSLSKGVKSVFTREGSEQQAQDGMDMVLCTFDQNLKSLEFAGAKNPLFIIQNGELIKIKGDSYPIGGETELDFQFQTHKIELQKGNCIYMLSDGYQDQFGGPKGKKFMIKRFKELLLSIHEKGMQEQKEIIHKSITDWKGSQPQVDDICVIGIRV